MTLANIKSCLTKTAATRKGMRRLGMRIQRLVERPSREKNESFVSSSYQYRTYAGHVKNYPQTGSGKKRIVRFF